VIIQYDITGLFWLPCQSEYDSRAIFVTLKLHMSNQSSDDGGSHLEQVCSIHLKYVKYASNMHVVENNDSTRLNHSSYNLPGCGVDLNCSPPCGSWSH
jgi:hypothetical protein